ncbi:Phosphoribosylaminoimidazole-succinocarboxamide synthase [Dirofilaria immitis]
MSDLVWVISQLTDVPGNIMIGGIEDLGIVGAFGGKNEKTVIPKKIFDSYYRANEGGQPYHTSFERIMED